MCVSYSRIGLDRQGEGGEEEEAEEEEEEANTVTFPLFKDVPHPTASNPTATRLDVVNVMMYKCEVCETFLREQK